MNHLRSLAFWLWRRLLATALVEDARRLWEDFRSMGDDIQ